MMLRILIIGERCIDRFIYGEVNRLSPEAPIPVFIPTKTTENPGMAENVLRNFNSVISNSDFDVKGIFQLEEITKTRYVDDKSNYPFIRVDEGEKKISRILLTPELISEIQGVDAVIVSDYDKGFLNEEDLLLISQNSKFSVLDTKKKISKQILVSFDFIKLNRKECELNQDLVTDNLEKVIVTLGSEGATYKGILYPSSLPMETIDVSGAGDTFVASFVKKYLETKDIEVSITFANKMANKVVQFRGVTTP